MFFFLGHLFRLHRVDAVHSTDRLFVRFRISALGRRLEVESVRVEELRTLLELLEISRLSDTRRFLLRQVTANVVFNAAVHFVSVLLGVLGL